MINMPNETHRNENPISGYMAESTQIRVLKNYFLTTSEAGLFGRRSGATSLDHRL